MTTENVVTLELRLHRMEVGFVQLVRDALSTEQVAAAVKRAIAGFDFDAEVQRFVDREIRSAVESACRFAMKHEIEAIRRRAEDATKDAAEEVRKSMARRLVQP